MKDSASATKSISLKTYGITHDNINYQLSPDELHDITIELGMGKEASSGALAVNTGEFTGRSPMDRFIVKDDGGCSVECGVVGDGDLGRCRIVV